jgi:hypothetical protein
MADVVERIHELQAAGRVIHRYQYTLGDAAGRQSATGEIEVLSAAEEDERNRNSDERSNGQGQATSLLQNASDLNLQNDSCVRKLKYSKGFGAVASRGLERFSGCAERRRCDWPHEALRHHEHRDGRYGFNAIAAKML